MKSIVEILKQLINVSDAIVIGAGAGLSAAAGFNYGGEFFKNNFPEMYKLGYRDMYSAGFHNFLTSEEKRAYWSKQIYYCRYQGAKKLYQNLFEIVKNKNYFVITTNADHQFQLAGFDKNRLYYTQGDYGLFQCSKPCRDKTYDNEETIMKMVKEQKNNVIPSSLIPKCPICGREMTTNLRIDDKFVQDNGWYKAGERYNQFLNENKEKKILFLELGVGFNTPGIIKIPFIQMTQRFQDAHYVVINKGENYLPKEIKNKTIMINEDINDIIALILK